jgi:hypothetical protein
VKDALRYRPRAGDPIEAVYVDVLDHDDEFFVDLAAWSNGHVLLWIGERGRHLRIDQPGQKFTSSFVDADEAPVFIARLQEGHGAVEYRVFARARFLDLYEHDRPGQTS